MHESLFIELFQDRRILQAPRKKGTIKTTLPDIKYANQMAAKRLRESDPTGTRIAVGVHVPKNFDKGQLSNLLISKRIGPHEGQVSPKSPFLLGKRRVYAGLQKSVGKQPTVDVHMRGHSSLTHRKEVKEVTKHGSDKRIQNEDHAVPCGSNPVINDHMKESVEQFFNVSQCTHSTALDKVQAQNQSLIVQEQQQIQAISRSLRSFGDEYLTFSIQPANNNEDLVRSLLLRRRIWRETKPGECVPNLKWLFTKERCNYKKLWSYTQMRATNHFEFDQQVTTKDNLIRNLQIYCETKKLEMFTLTPVTFIIDFDDEYCEYNLKQFLSFFARKDPRKNATGRNNNSSSGGTTYLNGQATSISQRLQPFMSWQNSDIKKKVNLLSRPIDNPCYYSEKSFLWLLKPTGLNRGRGIEIFDSLEQLEKTLMGFLSTYGRKPVGETGPRKLEAQKNFLEVSQKEINNLALKNSSVKTDIQKQQVQAATEPKSPGQQSAAAQDSSNPEQIKTHGFEKFKLNNFSFVLQKYIESPLLIEGRKFDIRVWALLNDKLELFFFRQGYIRTATQSYSTQNTDNYFIHLTNNAIQKNSSQYGAFESGNQLSYRDLVRYLPEESVARIWERMKQITFMVFSSVKRKINSYQRRNCFELFGMDFIVDSCARVWLIQVNENPCIECSSPLLSDLVPRMVNDALRLTVDHLFERRPTPVICPVPGYSDQENLWDSLGHISPNSDYNAKKNAGLPVKPKVIEKTPLRVSRERLPSQEHL